jgi:Rrf2 family protein
MAENLRFATGIEVLVLLATDPERYHTSQALAAVLATNPVVVRRILGDLSRAGIVASAKGPSGGTRLSLGPKQITLRGIYRALGRSDLLHRSKHESAEMKDIKNAIHNAFRKAEKCLESELDSTTLNQLIKKSGRRAAKLHSELPPKGAASIAKNASAVASQQG